MSTERDKLAAEVADIFLDGCAHEAGGIDIANAVLAHLYPTVNTAEELDALPVGTVVLSALYHSDVDGTAISFQRWYDGDWHRGARSGSTHPDNFLPATVLYVPEATK